jgi:hypothetical protein
MFYRSTGKYCGISADIVIMIEILSLSRGTDRWCYGSGQQSWSARALSGRFLCLLQFLSAARTMASRGPMINPKVCRFYRELTR